MTKAKLVLVDDETPPDAINKLREMGGFEVLLVNSDYIESVEMLDDINFDWTLTAEDTRIIIFTRYKAKY